MAVQAKDQLSAFPFSRWLVVAGYGKIFKKWFNLGELMTATAKEVGKGPERHVSARRLQFELVRNPPPYSKLPGARVINAFVIVSDDPAWAARCAWVAIQSMTALKRFSQRLDRLIGIGRENGLSLTDIRLLTAYGEDFYESWNVSSSEIIHALGIDVTVEILRFLKDHFHLTWPGTSLDWVEEGQFTSGPIQVFRGQSRTSPERPEVDGLSWSLSRSVAQYYASKNNNGVVYQASVEFRDVLLFQQEELEVVIDPKAFRFAAQGYLRPTVVEEVGAAPASSLSR